MKKWNCLWLLFLCIACTPRARVQDPQPPFPYHSKEVGFDSGDIHLAGTLTLPERAGPHPAILLLTGSGPQNRNEEVHGHRPFLVIADYLTRQGFAVLRVDDRGVGASTGVFDRNLTLGDLTLDAVAGLRYLQNRPEIKQDSLGLLGHSQGGVIASRVALEAEVAFVITLAHQV